MTDFEENLQGFILTKNLTIVKLSLNLSLSFSFNINFEGTI
jgi:hypothetical protein